jgi:hypothetical protein
MVAGEPGQYFVIEPNFSGASNFQLDALLYQGGLKSLRREPDGFGPVVIALVVYMRCNYRGGNSRGYGVSCKLQRSRQILRTIVQAGKQMTVEINHAFLDEYPA